MTRILRIDEILRNHYKPSLEPIETLQLTNNDTFILCAGFEDRAIGAFKHTVTVNQCHFKVIIFDYLPYVEQNRMGEIIDICRKNNLPYEKITYDREDPAWAGENFNKIQQPSIGRTYIDISGMSRLLIVQLLVYFLRENRTKNISIIYSEASEYPPTKEDVDEELAKNESPEDLTRTIMFISSGVFHVALVPELASVAMQGQPLHLIAFPSFNTQQLVTLRSEIQPHYYIFIHGVPLLEENQWRTNAIRKLNDIEKIPSSKELYLSTFNYEDTLNILFDIYGKYNEFRRIIIAPTGSKMQSVAVGIFRAFMADIQIVYPTPITFIEPHKYTIGVRQTYKLDLDIFSSFLHEKIGRSKL